MDPLRSIDFAGVRDGSAALQCAILALLRRRENPMRRREIEKWFGATSPERIGEALTVLSSVGRIAARRTTLGHWRYRAGLVYSADPATERVKALEGQVYGEGSG